MSPQSWEAHSDAQESAGTGQALTDMADDLEWLAGEFPALAGKAQGLRADILALPGWPRDDAPVEWAGRTFGQLTTDEKHRVTRAAGAQLSAELAASAGAISAVLDQPLPGEEPGKGDLVRFCQMDPARTMLEGRVTKPVWGTRSRNVSIRTTEEKSRCFVRLVADVEIIAKAAS